MLPIDKAIELHKRAVSTLLEILVFDHNRWELERRTSVSTLLEILGGIPHLAVIGSTGVGVSTLLEILVAASEPLDATDICYTGFNPS